MVNRKHYTRQIFAEALVGFVPTKPIRIFEPCCGDGSLLRAAGKAWPQARLEGIEWARKAAGVAAQSVPTARIQVRDALSTPWLVGGRRPCLVICNPPFNGESSQAHNIRTDFRFFAKAFIAIKHGGTALLVVPFSVAANPSFLAWRRHVLAGFSLHSAIQLPYNAFEDTDAAAVALVLTTEPVARTRFLELTSHAKVANEVSSLVDASYRLDPHYYLSRAALPRVAVPTLALADFTTKVHRGRFIPIQRRRRRHRGAFGIVGLTELSGSPIRRFSSSASDVNTSGGDLLISRVGRRAGLDVMLIQRESGAVVANDCAYILTPKHLGGYLAAAFLTGYVRAQVLAVRRGMAARVLSKDDLLRVRIPLLPKRRMSYFSEQWQRHPERRARLLARLNLVLFSTTGRQ